MVLSASSTYGLLLLLSLSQLGHAQSDSARSWLAHTEVRSYPTYFEKITYNGKHQEYYTVNTYLNDSTLYRVDNYKRIYAANAYPSYQQGDGRVPVREGPSKIVYPSGQVYLSAIYKMNALNGPFIVFYADGAVKRKELYHLGQVKESHCYNPEGEEQPCDAYYKQARFMGKPQELKSYLEKSFQSIVDGQSVWSIQVQLTINEIGQISRTTVVADPNSAALNLTVEQIVRNMPHWNTVTTDWKPATIDGVPISEVWTIYVYRRRGFLYVGFFVVRTGPTYHRKFFWGGH